MPNYNKVLLMGNLTRDPELRYTPNGSAVTDFGIAVNRTWKGKDGEKHEEACFVDCTAWARTAEVITEYLTKGRPIFVEGHLKYDTWEKDGKRQSKLKVIVENFQFIGGKDDKASSPGKPDNSAPGGSKRDDEIPF